MKQFLIQMSSVLTQSIWPLAHKSLLIDRNSTILKDCRNPFTCKIIEIDWNWWNCGIKVRRWNSTSAEEITTFQHLLTAGRTYFFQLSRWAMHEFWGVALMVEDCMLLRCTCQRLGGSGGVWPSDSFRILQRGIPCFHHFPQRCPCPTIPANPLTSLSPIFSSFPLPTLHGSS